MSLTKEPSFHFYIYNIYSGFTIYKMNNTIPTDSRISEKSIKKSKSHFKHIRKSTFQTFHESSCGLNKNGFTEYISKSNLSFDIAGNIIKNSIARDFSFTITDNDQIKECIKKSNIKTTEDLALFITCKIYGIQDIQKEMIDEYELMRLHEIKDVLKECLEYYIEDTNQFNYIIPSKRMLKEKIDQFYKKSPQKE